MSRLYKLYGTTQLRELKQSVTNKVNHWLSEWSGASEGLQSLEIITESNLCPNSSELYSVYYELDDEVISLSVEDNLYQNFPALLLPMNAMVKNDHSPMVAEILNKVFLDLLKPYMKLAGLKSTQQKSLSKECLLNFDLSGNKGNLLVKIEFSTGVIYLQLPYIVIEKMNLQVDEKAIKLALVKRSDCAISGDIKLAVNVGGVEVDFGSVVGMREGDVIRLDSKIVDKMEVKTNDGSFVCHAHLGKQNKNKAIKIII